MKESHANLREKEPIPGWLVVVGGVPLLVAMAVEFAGVVLRNIGLPIPGSIELVEACVLLSSSTAILVATISRSHAKVRVLLNRVRGPSNRALKTAIALGATVFFLCLVAGSVWIMSDMWGEAEHSETLRIPYMPLRAFVTLCMAATAALYARRLLRPGGDR